MPKTAKPIVSQANSNNTNLCWICNGNAATTGEHTIKRSDLAAIFGHTTQENPLYFHQSQKPSKKVGSLDAKLLKMPNQLCNQCNSNRTQPHDKAWEHMSDWLRKRPIDVGQFLHSNKIFPYDTRTEMTKVHLYFVKLFGCMLFEARTNGINVPIHLQPFSDAIMNNRPHPEVFLEFGRGDGTIGGSQLVCWKSEIGSMLAGCFLQLDSIAVKMMFAQSGALENNHNLWHPLSPTTSKRFRFKNFDAQI
jgi:hypothetical protein